jgi:hypothetical protein
MRGGPADRLRVNLPFGDVYTWGMRRTQLYLTDEQRGKLRSLAKAEGVSEAEVVRRILARTLGGPNIREQRLAAVEDTAGLLTDAPDWPDWLASVRGKGVDRRLKELGL